MLPLVFRDTSSAEVFQLLRHRANHYIRRGVKFVERVDLVGDKTKQQPDPRLEIRMSFHECHVCRTQCALPDRLCDEFNLERLASIDTGERRVQDRINTRLLLNRLRDSLKQTTYEIDCLSWTNDPHSNLWPTSGIGLAIWAVRRESGPRVLAELFGSEGELWLGKIGTLKDISAPRKEMLHWRNNPPDASCVIALSPVRARFHPISPASSSGTIPVSSGKSPSCGMERSSSISARISSS